MSALPAASRLRGWSRERREPEWLTRRRLDALELAAGQGVREPLLEGPPLRQPLRAPELAAQGVSVSTLRAAVESEPDAVRAALPPLDRAASGADAAHEALWTDGFFARVPDGVEAAVPLQLGSDLARAARERTLVVVGERASLSLVEGCAGASGAAPRRESVVDASIGAGGSLTSASVQAWPPGVVYRSLKRLAAGAGARAQWRDVSLGARETDKRLHAALAPGAEADLEAAGFAAEGQRQRLEVFASGEGRARLASRCATRGGSQRTYLLAAPGGRVERSEAVLDLAALGEPERLYLATRGLEGRAAEAAALHAFFETFASRLPLEFSVELTRLLDAELGDS